MIGSVLPAEAQLPLTPRALGMGGAYIGVARGQEALFLNPANIGLPGNPHWSVAFPQIVAGGTTLGLGFDDFRDIQNYDDVTEERANEILADIPASGTRVDYDVRVPAAAVQVGRFAVGVSYTTLGGHGVSKDLADLFLRGYREEELRTSFDVGNTRGSRASFIDIAVGHGRRFGPVSVGATGHYYMGRFLARSALLGINANPFALPGQRVQAEYAGVYTDEGSGYGLDIGAAMQPIPGLTVSAAIGNAIGKMDWSEDLKVRSVVLTEDDLENGEFLDITKRYENSERAFNAGTDARLRTLADSVYHEAGLPRTLRLGAAFEPRLGTQVAASYHTDMTESRLGGSWDSQLGLGVQQKLRFLTVRAGAATNLDDGSMLTGGLSLGPLQFGVARFNDGEVEGTDRSGWIASFGLAARTNSIMQ